MGVLVQGFGAPTRCPEGRGAHVVADGLSVPLSGDPLAEGQPSQPCCAVQDTCRLAAPHRAGLPTEDSVSFQGWTQALLWSVHSSPARHLPLCGGEPGTAPGSGSLCCSWLRSRLLWSRLTL